VTFAHILPVLIVATSLAPGIAIFLLREDQKNARTALNLAGAILKLVLVAVLLWGVAQGRVYQTRYQLVEGIDFALHADPFSLLFVTLSAVLWLVTTIYAIGYLEHAPNRSRFFGFFSLCVSATTGIALAGNLFTFLVFYEVLTITTYPLVVHRGTPEALAAGRVYLLYTLTAGAVLLVAMVWLSATVGAVDFEEPADTWRRDTWPRRVRCG
jgi:multicomponent Na+:H+ antiporter subunit D